MGLFKNYVSQARKPEGFLGKTMLRGMNSGHAKMADWGFSHLPEISVSEAADLGCGGGRNAGELLKRYPNAHVTAIDYSELEASQNRGENTHEYSGYNRSDNKKSPAGSLITVMIIPAGFLN